MRSLDCACKIAEQLEQHTDLQHWQKSLLKLAQALKFKPERFDRTWPSKVRFSMDWFYPILAGLYSKEETQARLTQRESHFIEDTLGCRCVSDEPWITVAETCEYTLALMAAGKHEQAKKVHLGLIRWQDGDGGFWTGYNFKTKTIWPKEKTSWTAGAFIIAADAIYKMTPASDLFLTSIGEILEPPKL